MVVVRCWEHQVLCPSPRPEPCGPAAQTSGVLVSNTDSHRELTLKWRGTLDSPQEIGPASWASQARVGDERGLLLGRYAWAPTLWALGPWQSELPSCLPPATPTQSTQLRGLSPRPGSPKGAPLPLPHSGHRTPSTVLPRGAVLPSPL